MLLLLKEDRSVCGICEEYEEFERVTSFSSCGSFRLVLPFTQFSQAKEARYLFDTEGGKTALIRSLSCLIGEGGRRVELRGENAEGLLSLRVASGAITLTGSASDAVSALVTSHFLTSPRTLSCISGIATLTLTDTLLYQIKAGEPISEALYGSLNEIGAYPTLTLGSDDKFLIGVRKGQERTNAVFSVSLSNAEAFSYEKKREGANFAYVAGWENRSETVSLVGTGEERREKYVDCTKVRLTAGDSAMTEAEYSALLRKRGRETLLAEAKTEAVSVSVGEECNLRYGTDYDLGDTVWLEDSETGISKQARITEIREKNGALSLSFQPLNE